MRILIAGAGDLGGRVAALLRHAGHDVSVIARRARDHDSSIIALDLTRPIAKPLPATFDWILHCLSPATRDEAAYRAIYVDALRHLLNALPDVRRVAFVSSTAVYGDHDGGRVDESADCRPAEFNGRLLREAEQQLQSSGRQPLILRLGGIYGPGRDMLLRRVRSGLPLAVSNPPLYSNRIHIDDAARAIGHLLEHDAHGVFNLVDDEAAAQPDVLDWLAARMGLLPLPREASDHAKDNKRVQNHALRATGFVPDYPDFRAGYGAMLAKEPQRDQ